MIDTSRSLEWGTGILFGAWLGGIYAAVSHGINILFMPGIPLAAPSGSFSVYIMQYMGIGALLGFASAFPENRWMGMVLGGFSAAALNIIISLVQKWGFESFGSTLLTSLFTFLPMMVLMMPLGLLIRLGVDARHIDPTRPYLWARRFIIPFGISLLIMGLGTLSLYAPQARTAFYYTKSLVEQGMRSTNAAALPTVLRDVKDFSGNAAGAYSMTWSDRADTFFGPSPVGSELSQFLIIVQYQNGFRFACLFSENRVEPNCTNY